MHVKIFSLKFDANYGGFNDEVIQDFLKDKQVISIQEYFFKRHEVPYLTLVIQYSFGIQGFENRSGNFQPKQQQDWKQELSESDMGLFDLLRNWRLQRSKKEGVPPYILFSNAQLSKIVKARPQSETELGKIDGVGQAKIEKYGNEILEITKIKLDISTPEG